MYNHLFNDIYSLDENALTFDEMFYQLRLKRLKNYLNNLSSQERYKMIEQLKNSGKIQ